MLDIVRVSLNQGLQLEVNIMMKGWGYKFKHTQIYHGKKWYGGGGHIE